MVIAVRLTGPQGRGTVGRGSLYGGEGTCVLAHGRGAGPLTPAPPDLVVERRGTRAPARRGGGPWPGVFPTAEERFVAAPALADHTTRKGFDQRRGRLSPATFSPGRAFPPRIAAGSL